MRYIKIVFVPILIFASIYILIYQPQILEIPVFKSLNLPLGSLISWLLVFLIPMFFYLNLGFRSDSKAQQWLKIILKVNILVSLLWGFISYLIAGNWNFIFTNNTGLMRWIGFTTIIVITPLLIFLFWVVLKLIRLFQKE